MLGICIDGNNGDGGMYNGNGNGYIIIGYYLDFYDIFLLPDNVTL